MARLTSLVCALGLCSAWTMLASVLFAGDPAAQEKPSPYAGYFKDRGRMAARVNGLLLQVSIASNAEPKLALTKVDWKLDYTGKRSPCNVLEPSMNRATSGQTEIIVYAEGAGGLRDVTVAARFTKCQYFAERAWFVSIPEGQAVTGSFEFDLTEAKELLLKRFPRDFRADKAPVLYIQVCHKPSDRGAGFDLDAWTGELWTPVIRLPLKQW